MHRFLLGASLAFPALAQEPAPLTQGPGKAFAAFQSTQGGQWIAQWHAATGTPSSIYGTGIPLADWRENTLDEARRHANLQLQQHRELLGLGASDFRESIGARMGRTWSFTFDQWFGGLPVIGGRADLRIHMKGVVSMLGSEAVPIPAGFATVPTVAEAVAVATAWATLGQAPTGVAQPGKPRAPRLVIWADLQKQDGIAAPHLAWEVPISNVDAGGDGPVGRYYVDARTGSVLTYHNDKHSCGLATCGRGTPTPATTTRAPDALPTSTTVTLMCWTRTGIDGQSGLVNVPLPGVMLTIPGATPSSVTTDANGTFTIDISAPVTVSVGNLSGRHHAQIVGGNAPSGSFTVNPGVPATLQLSSSLAIAPTTAHPTTSWFVDSVNEWVRSIVGNSTQMNTADQVVPAVNINSNCNAYYTNNTINFYVAGNGCVNTAFSNVITHEWGHGLDDRYGGISNNNGDGLSEGWGDIVGMYHLDTPLLGSGLQTAGVPLRNGMNTTMYGTVTEVHDAGEVWMGFAWRYRENLRAAYGTPTAISVSNDTVMASIVANANNQVAAVQQVFLADDDDGNLTNGTPHYAQLSAAAAAKGIPYPVVYALIGHTPLATPGPSATPRVVQATVTTVAPGTITGTRLVFDAGGGTVTRNMKPGALPDQYAAVLPARSDGTVTYHIEADHSAGQTIRMPATGEYTYTVPGGAFTSFFLENFDGATSNGWTFGQTTGTHEWQRGLPAGKNGTSLSVFWSDPNTSPSFPNCFAVDLGLGTSNGRYNASTDQYLRSPIIDCSGRYGVRLRFQRWLTVERGTNDQAIITCNGVQVWANPLTAHTLDTAWQAFELDLPMADNNPSVQLEWRLVSDASLNLGGWQIDDVELGATSMPVPDARMFMVPEQVAAGRTAAVAVITPGGPRPFLVGIGDTPGPTSIPGIPTFQVGGTLDVFSATTDANGNWYVTFTAPAVAPALSVTFYMQALTFDPTFTSLVISNAYVTMFTDTP